MHASPPWDAPQVGIFFWFIRDDSDADFEGRNWADFLKDWLKLIPPAGRFHTVEGEVATLRDMSARDYVDSDPLDLDHLSSGPS